MLDNDKVEFYLVKCVENYNGEEWERDWVDVGPIFQSIESVLNYAFAVVNEDEYDTHYVCGPDGELSLDHYKETK